MKKELQELLNREIPLSKALGVTVREAGAKTVLQAPIIPNTNHKRSAFGGSLYSVAVLTGWSWIWAKMQEEGISGHIVIAGSEMEYLGPVLADFTASCEGCDDEDWERATEMFAKKGKARVTLEVIVQVAGRELAVLIGDYALVR